MGIGRLGPDRYRVFVDLGVETDGRRAQYTQVVRGTRQEAEGLERELRAAVKASDATVNWLRVVAIAMEVRSQGADAVPIADQLLSLAEETRALANSLEVRQTL